MNLCTRFNSVVSASYSSRDFSGKSNRLLNRASRNSCRSVRTACAVKPKPTNPEDFELDDEYYRELDMDDDDLDAQTTFHADDIDPDASLFNDDVSGGEDEATAGGSLNMSGPAVYGPQAVLLAGLGFEEVAMTRALLDTAGAAQLKVVPCSSEMMHLPMREAVAIDEVDWSLPRPDHWNAANTMGSTRAAVFSGVNLEIVAMVIELMEESGMPPLCAAMAVECDAERPLGAVLSHAIREQRGRKLPQSADWELESVPSQKPRAAPEPHDMEAVMQEATRARFEELNNAAAAGSEEMAEALSRGAVDMTSEEVANFRQARRGSEQPLSEHSGYDATPAASQEAVPNSASPQFHPATWHHSADPPTAPSFASAESLPAPLAPMSSMPSMPQVNGSTADLQPTAIPQPSTASAGNISSGDHNASGYLRPGEGYAASIIKPLHALPAGPAVPTWLQDRKPPTATEQHLRLFTQTSLRMEGCLPSPPPCAADIDSFYAKFMFESLAMQQAKREAKAVIDRSIPGNWQEELAQVRATGETRSDMLAKAGVRVSTTAPPLPSSVHSPTVPSAADSPQQGRSATAGAATVPTQQPADLSDLDIIDRIANESVQPKEVQLGDEAAVSEAEAEIEAAAIVRLDKLLTRLPIRRESVEKALKQGASTAEVLTQIEKALESVEAGARSRADTQTAQSDAPWRTPPAATSGVAYSGSDALPFGKAKGNPGQSTNRRRLPIRRLAKQSSNVRVGGRAEVMTAQQVINSAHKHGKNPDSWLSDARKRGILSSDSDKPPQNE